MTHSHAEPPALFPILSRGKHRNPSKGACFMEMAAFLAGEPWSDHPGCTHPLLAQLARLVNDYTSDARRPQLAELIPSVIGLTSDDVRVDATIALRCARVALPIVSADRQNVMAVAILSASRVLAERDGRPSNTLEGESRYALEQAPIAAKWAGEFSGTLRISPQVFRRRSAPITVRSAVEGIAEACVSDPDDVLHELLVDAIHDVETICGHQVAAVPQPRDAAPMIID